MNKCLLAFKQVIVAWCLFGVFSVSAAVHVTYLPADSKNDAHAKQAIVDSEINSLIIELAKEHFPFKNNLTIQYGGEEGPLYDPEIHTVLIPYSFYTEAFNYFKKNNYEDKFSRTAELGAIDTILHTLLHETGHAYIEDQAIPVLGKEEDAVDNFAAIIMIEYVDNGDDSTISAADMFAFESQDRPDYYQADEYIDEHSFDLQRYFSTLCLVYGSNPEKYAELLDEIEPEQLIERKEFCVYHFQTISKNWHHYLTSENASYF
ncbi:DUF4344 domain-containing metallopeptidase [Vibrio kasasachensis]|uniref:DUF4344 domain-containing metallopeptidase n=1 Tax=Vibrio kasasachensis TaxID=2910248 RepID=UPI003D0D4FF1